MRLYHFTDALLWGQILESGRLDPERAKWGDGTPKVVHLSHHNHVGSLPETHWGCDLRITVDVDRTDVTPWGRWMEEFPELVPLNNPALGGLPVQWFVSAVPIERPYWAEVHRVSWDRVWPQ